MVAVKVITSSSLKKQTNSSLQLVTVIHSHVARQLGFKFEGQTTFFALEPNFFGFLDFFLFDFTKVEGFIDLSVAPLVGASALWSFLGLFYANLLPLPRFSLIVTLDLAWSFSRPSLPPQ